MQYEPTTPQQDGFSMPAEFSPHQGCILIWPERPGSWKNGAAAARKAFRSVIAAIAESETVYVAVNPHSRPSAERMLAGMANVRLLDLDSDDAWARDVAPTFVRRAADGAVRGVNWRFNAWGGEVDGLYAHWEKDDAFAGSLLDMLGFRAVRDGGRRRPQRRRGHAARHRGLPSECRAQSAAHEGRDRRGALPHARCEKDPLAASRHRRRRDERARRQRLRLCAAG